MQMVLGYLMVTWFDVMFDPIPLDNPIFLFTVAIPISYNGLIVILLCVIFSRVSTIVDLIDIKSLCALNPYNLTKRIKLVMILNDKINDCIMCVNRTYVFNIMIALLDVKAVLIFTTFLSYKMILNEYSTADLVLIIGSYSYAICIGIGCFVIIFYSASIKKAHAAILNSLIKIHMLLWNRRNCKMMPLAILQLSHFRKEISAGLFELNWKYGLTVLSSIFNYVIVMIQFDAMLSPFNQ